MTQAGPLRAALLALALGVMTPAWAQTSAAAPSLFDEAEEALALYNPDRADELADAYARKRKKGAAVEADRVADPAAPGSTVDKVELLHRRAETMRGMLRRVEDIEVLDSINLPADRFFEAYRLTAPAGALLAADRVAGLADGGLWEPVDPIYATEDRSRLLYAAWPADGRGEPVMAERMMLADGSWTPAEQLFTRSQIFADGLEGQVYAPWLMTDGVTVYFAADGPTGLGGLDLYIARRADSPEAEGSAFLQPSNLGMPYNSPANDYMLAIDEEAGLGWWATDRNSPDGSEVTVYLFRPAELRVNLPADSPGLEARARLASIADTWRGGSKPDVDVRGIVAAVPSPLAPKAEAEAEFVIEMPDGRRFTRGSEITNRDARALLPRLRELTRLEADTREALSRARSRYAAGNAAQAQRIIELETSLTATADALAQTRNRLISLLN